MHPYGVPTFMRRRNLLPTYRAAICCRDREKRDMTNRGPAPATGIHSISCVKSRSGHLTLADHLVVIFSFLWMNPLLPSLSAQAYQTRLAVSAGWTVFEHSLSKGLETGWNSRQSENRNSHWEVVNHPGMGLPGPAFFRS